MKPYLTRIRIFQLISVFVIVFISVSVPVIVTLLAYQQFKLTKATEEVGLSKEETGGVSEHPGKMIVKFKQGVGKETSEAILRSKTSPMKLYQEESYVYDVTPGEEETEVNALKNNPNVDYIEPDRLRYLYEVPNDQYFSQQWGQYKINTPTAWDKSKSGAEIKVALIDSGIAQNHPDVTSKVVLWKNFVTGEGQYDIFGHGTFVAGIIGALTNNSMGVAGTGYNVRLISAKVTNQKGLIYASTAADAIRWAADNGAQIINCSVGGSYGTNYEDDAVQYAWSRGAIIVAAAGNEGTSSKRYPASYANVIGVAATDKGDQKTKWSNYGSWVDIAAPGVEIISTEIPNKYATYSGTSFSAPHVSGVLALMKAYYKSYSNQQIVDKLCQTADHTGKEGTYWTCGRVNAASALGAVPTSPTITPLPTTSPKPTAISTALPSEAPNGKLSFKIRFQGITKKALDQKITVAILNSSQTVWNSNEVNSQSDINGVYLVPTTNTLTAGTYSLLIKGSSHLQKRITNLSVASPTQIIDLSSQEADEQVAGDVTGDNRITIEDISQVLSYYTDFSVPVNSQDLAMVASDVNKDGKITIIDVALLALNWRDFVVKGDE